MLCDHFVQFLCSNCTSPMYIRLVPLAVHLYVTVHWDLGLQTSQAFERILLACVYNYALVISLSFLFKTNHPCTYTKKGLRYNSSNRRAKLGRVFLVGLCK